MRQWGQRCIKYEAELDKNFASEINERVGDDSMNHCIQCGTCSATCPVSLYMDYTPRRIVAMAREGFKDEILGSFSPWVCASCYSCTVECPRDVKITEIMYAIKQKAIEEKVHSRRFPIPVLAKEFFNSVVKLGRTNEGRLITKVFLKTNPLNLIKQSFLGLRLLSKGRMEIFADQIKDKKQLRTLLKAVEKPTGPAANA